MHSRLVRQKLKARLPRVVPPIKLRRIVQPGGLADSSRGLSQATPPGPRADAIRTPEGCQKLAHQSPPAPLENPTTFQGVICANERLVGGRWPCSADWQSAVSRIGNPQVVQPQIRSATRATDDVSPSPGGEGRGEGGRASVHGTDFFGSLAATSKTNESRR